MPMCSTDFFLLCVTILIVSKQNNKAFKNLRQSPEKCKILHTNVHNYKSQIIRFEVEFESSLNKMVLVSSLVRA